MREFPRENLAPIHSLLGNVLGWRHRASERAASRRRGQSGLQGLVPAPERERVILEGWLDRGDLPLSAVTCPAPGSLHSGAPGWLAGGTGANKNLPEKLVTDTKGGWGIGLSVDLRTKVFYPPETKPPG